MRKKGLALVLACLMQLFLCSFSMTAVSAEIDEGVRVPPPSLIRTLVSEESLERQSSLEYEKLKINAAKKHKLASDSDPRLKHLRLIAERILPHTAKFNAHAGQWRWEVNLIDSPQINAFCMPGGKIVFYTGILTNINLSDDEVGIVMGHEIAHALREHVRDREAKRELTDKGLSILNEKIGGGRYEKLFEESGELLNLSFSRKDESDADIVGLELAAKAGIDPRAGISLWSKMIAASKDNAPPQWLSTHPSGPNRIKSIELHLPEVMPIYQQSLNNN